jgi:Holliday junction resolvasome RuvABC ATP-dependent DNA helicase subunit
MAKIQINTKKSLYEPIEIEIDGKSYAVKRITRDVLKKIREYDEKVSKGDLDAAYKRLELFIGKHKAINELGLDELNEVTNFIIHNIISPKRIEKNSQRPADEKSQ